MRPWHAPRSPSGVGNDERCRSRRAGGRPRERRRRALRGGIDRQPHDWTRRALRRAARRALRWPPIPRRGRDAGRRRGARRSPLCRRVSAAGHHRRGHEARPGRARSPMARALFARARRHHRLQRQDHGQGNAGLDPEDARRRARSARDQRQFQQRYRRAAHAAAPAGRASLVRDRARHESSRRNRLSRRPCLADGGSGQ